MKNILKQCHKILELNDSGINESFLERVRFISNNQDLNFSGDRELSIPYYVTDLGIREIKSPKMLYKNECLKLGIEELTTDEIYSDLKSLPLKKVHKLFDIITFFIGDYDTLEIFIMNEKENLLNLRNDELNIYSGTILSAKNNKNCELFFNNFINKKNYSYLTGQHRLAVFNIKREKNNIKAKKVITDIIEILNFKKHSDDKLALLALLNNLYPLTENSLDTKKLLLTSALYTSDTVILKAGPKKDMAQRYKGQILLNYSQLYFFDKEYSKGLDILMLSLNEFEKTDSEYIAEIYGSIGYGMFLNKEYEKSIKYLKIASEEYGKVGDLEGKLFCLKVLVASSHKTNNLNLYNDSIKDMEKIWIE
jgi:hypothetical protein